MPTYGEWYAETCGKGEHSGVRRILKRGGRSFWKFEKNKDLNLKLSHSNFVPFFAQNQVKSKKKSSLKFRPIFRPKSSEEQKKRSSLKFRPIFAQNQVKSKKKKKGLHSDFVLFFAQSLEETRATYPLWNHTWCPTCKGGGACLNFAHFSMQFRNLGDPKGSAMAQWPPPPKYAPGWTKLKKFKNKTKKRLPKSNFHPSKNALVLLYSPINL